MAHQPKKTFSKGKFVPRL